MDLGDSGAWPVILADWQDRLLSFWHGHRILAITACTLLVLALAAFRARPRLPQNLSPSSEEKTAWLDDTVGNASKAGIRTYPAKSVESEQKTLAAARLAPRVVTGRKPARESKGSSQEANTIQPLIFFSSLTGTTERLSKDVATSFAGLAKQNTSILPPQVHDLSYVDLDDYFISGAKSDATPFYILLIPSYDIDTIINTFLAHLDETHNDFRIDTAPLSRLVGYAVFGIGDRQGWPDEEAGFCTQAIQVDKWMAKLTGRKRAYPLGLGDVNDIEHTLQNWITGVKDALQDVMSLGSLGEGVPGSGNPVESDEEDFPEPVKRKKAKLADLEDVGGREIDFTQSGRKKIKLADPEAESKPTDITPLKPMVPPTSPTYTALTKQGYTIIGSHSGVKICRWTKSALRGRGSCYKNSFYGIASHLCMETTPSLSCSNKCVFCWRHGTNPVSTTWRWEVDPPDMIFEGAKAGHYKKIKMMRGVPGVRAERFEEAMRIRHCALSLVGEPIFYPHINEFVGLLHGERISSFLVCNAQHPKELRALRRVTQLYVSIDASNRESLRRIDRPLHRDFWERFQECLDIIREKRMVQRTVFRLTLVKGFNVEEEVEGYADLVERGLPCFIEVKGVTYCGTSTAAGAGLTMGNVPFYAEVVEFVQGLNSALERRGLQYGIAAEHAHSCCVLIASRRFEVAGRWRTRIDYERFFELLEGGGEFAPEDYARETEGWALWGQGGFDPRDERVDRKGRAKEVGDGRRGVGKVAVAVAVAVADLPTEDEIVTGPGFGSKAVEKAQLKF
jgi:tRNA wybutosine-synthesizing protein 1